MLSKPGKLFILGILLGFLGMMSFRISIEIDDTFSESQRRHLPRATFTPAAENRFYPIHALPGARHVSASPETWRFVWGGATHAISRSGGKWAWEISLGEKRDATEIPLGSCASWESSTSPDVLKICPGKDGSFEFQILETRREIGKIRGSDTRIFVLPI